MAREPLRNASLASTFQGFADLAANRVEGVDYTLTVVARPTSSVAVIALHGGSIEQYTSEVARFVAGDTLNLYLLEGRMRAGNYAALHLTSHRFDEPRCLALLAECDHTVAIHGCAGDDAHVLVGGLDEHLKEELVGAIARTGFHCAIDNDQFPAREPMNVCNRNRRGGGSSWNCLSGFGGRRKHA